MANYITLTPLASANTNAYDQVFFYCLYCGRALEIKYGVVVHDDVEHPLDYDFGEDEKPQ